MTNFPEALDTALFTLAAMFIAIMANQLMQAFCNMTRNKILEEKLSELKSTYEVVEDDEDEEE